MKYKTTPFAPPLTTRVCMAAAVAAPKLRPRFITVLATAVAASLTSQSAQGASASWAANTIGDWVDDTKWTPATAPGVANATAITAVSTDIATFGFTLAAGGKTVTVDTNRNIGGITFSNTSGFGYTLNGGNLLLTNAGVIQTTAGGTHTDTIGSAIAIQGDGGSATFTASGATATSLLSIGGGVTGVSTLGNTTTLTLNGANTGANAMTGIIGDGGDGGKLAVIKSPAGTWTLANANTFTGGFTLSGGRLNINNATALGSAGNTFVISGGTISANTTLAAYAHSWTGNFAAVGTVNMGTGAFDLNGVVSRTVTLTSGTDIITIGGAITNGGITALGNGTMTLAGANNYNGTTTVNADVTITGTNSGSGGYNLTAVSKTLRLGPGVNGGLGSGTMTTQNLSPTLRNDSGTAAVLTNTLNNGGFSLAGANDITFNGNTTLPFGGQATTNNSTATNGVTFAGTFGLSTFGLAFAGSGKTTISGQITGTTGNLTYSGTNLLTLSGATSNYAGVTTINNGTVSVSSIKNYSAASNLGAPASGSIVMGNNVTTGTLLYTGAGDTSNRTIRIGTNSTTPAVTNIGGATIQNDGAGGALTFNAVTFNTALGTATGVGADRVLTLQGSNIASNTISGIIQDNTISGTATGTSRIGVTKAGAGNWVLSGANIYSGNTSISAGTLKLGTGGSLAAGTNVSIAAGGTFDVTDLTLSSGTYTWNMASLSASGTATPATITGSAGGTVDMGSKPITLTYNGSNPPLTGSGAALSLGGNQTTVVVPGTALVVGVYTLVTAGSITGSVNPTPLYTGGNGVASGTTGVVSISGSSVILTVAAGGANYASWANSNGIPGEPASGDFDNDGLSNLVEYALGKNPTVSSQLPGTLSGGVLTFTKGSDAIANGDVNFVIEESTNLVLWAPVVTQNAPNASTTISYMLPTGQPKEFARLKVIQIP